MLIPTYLAPSAIHGSGLFTAAPVAKGARIWEFLPGLDVEFPEALLAHPVEAVAAYLRRYSYPHPVKAGVCILDGDNGRFMNHSERPNTDFRSPDGGYAREDIPAGTELTCDYAEFAPGFTFE